MVQIVIISYNAYWPILNNSDDRNVVVAVLKFNYPNHIMSPSLFKIIKYTKIRLIDEQTI